MQRARVFTGTPRRHGFEFMQVRPDFAAPFSLEVSGVLGLVCEPAGGRLSIVINHAAADVPDLKAPFANAQAEVDILVAVDVIRIEAAEIVEYGLRHQPTCRR